MKSVTGTTRAFDSRRAPAGGGAAPRSTRHLASGATFGVETARGSVLSNVSVLGLVLASKALRPVRRTAQRRGPSVAQVRDAARDVSAGRNVRDNYSRGLERKMTTRITQVDGQSNGDAVLKVEGSLTLEDARLLEGVCKDLRGHEGRGVRIDLSALSFLDEESASLLRGLKSLHGVELEGAHLFVRQVMEQAERNGDD